MSTPQLSIAHYSKHLPSDKPNGVSCQVHRLANALVTRGHRVICVSFSPKPTDGKYQHVLLSYTSPLKVIQKFEPGFAFSRKILQTCDIIHFHGDDYLTKESKPMIRTFYGSAAHEALHARSFSRFLYQAVFYALECISMTKREIVVGISESNKKFLPMIKTIVHCGVPIELYKPGKAKTDHPSILFCGDLSSRKNGNFLLSIFHTVIRPALPQCTLTIIGPQKATGTNVLWYSTVDESQLINLYQNSWLYCMVSSYEGFGVPAIEALACGTPVVALANGSIEHIVTDSVTGIVTNKQCYGSAVTSLLQNNLKRQQFSERGIQQVKQQYAMSIIVQHYEQIYTALLKRKGQNTPS